jgi:alanine racemase
MGRLAIATLSTENLLHNLEVLRDKAGNRKIMAMIKANGYGHGLRSTALRLDGRVYSFGVASIDEALALRHVGVKAPITLMSGAFEPEDIPIAAEQDFHLIFHENTQINWLENSNISKPIKTWFKINTGMGRLGFSPEEARTAYDILSNSSKIIQPIGIISHIACADDPINPMNQLQLDNFKNFTHNLPGPKSLCNSASIFSFEDDLYDIVRPGIALYGISPINGKTANELRLKPVMTLQTRLVATSIAKAGSSIGYGSRFVCPEDMPIGVIAMGYGDGYPRTARDGTPVLVNDQRCQLVGRVSMDMATIDLRNCPNAKVGDPVVLWGEGLPIEEVALHTDNIPYDIICGIQQRVKFYWTPIIKEKE